MRYIFFLIFVLMVNPVGAQSNDFSGVWKLTDQSGETQRLQIASQGNSWVGVPLAQSSARLILNPAGLRNQWVGDLTTDDKHAVKAELKSETILLTGLKSGQTWTLVRE